jgi:alpha-beta hydrolase superfamily lysophospholipase
MTEQILDHPGVKQVLFHPRPDYGFAEPGTHAVSIEVEPGVTIGGRLYPATAEAPAILYYHGNGEIASDYEDIADMYNRMGISLLVMDYRGYGSSSGEPTAANLVSDAVATFSGISHIFAAHELAPARLYVMGRSLGSVPAIELAQQSGQHLAGLIIESGFSDTFGLLGRMGVRAQGVDEQRDGFGNGFKMEQVTLPTLVMHGENDVLIPPADGQELYDRCGAEDKQLLLIPYAGHNDIMMVGGRQYFDAIRNFVVGKEGQLG